MRPSIVLILCYLIAFLACSPCEKYKNEIYKEDTFHRYFDTLGSKRMNKYLKMYKEPEMSTLNYEAYRLTYGHVFADTSHIIRIENQNSNYHFIHKKLIEDSDSTRAVIETIQKKLLVSEWDKLKEVIYQNSYWTLPKEIDRYGLDGGVWTIEGRRPDAEICGKRSYHLVSRWSPDKGEFQNLCNKFYEIIDAKELQ